MLSNLKNISSLELHFKDNDLGNNPKNLIFLGEGLKQLNKLTYLNLNLYNNNLGKYPNSIKFLLESLKNMEKLNYLNLNLQYNSLENNMIFFEVFREITTLKDL